MNSDNNVLKSVVEMKMKNIRIQEEGIKLNIKNLQ